MAYIVQLLSLPQFRFSRGVLYLRGMRHELHEFGRKGKVRADSRRLLPAQVAGAVLAAVKTIKSHDTPSNPKVFEREKLCEPHGQPRRHRGTEDLAVGHQCRALALGELEHFHKCCSAADGGV